MSDYLQPAENLKIERHIYFNAESADISRLTHLSVEQLRERREASAAAEQKIFENLCEATAAWEEQAENTLTLDKAIEYVRTPPVKHTANQWEKSAHNSDRQEMSNMVYAMSYYVYERTSYDRATEKSVPVAWELSWSVRTNTPGHYSDKIAGQDKKVYSDKADMEKYLAGRIKTYAHLFTEISPPIPQEYAKNFRVNGQLLPGYTVEGEEPKQPTRAAEVDNGGVPISEQQNTETRKEHENMNEPLNIKLSTREQYESGNMEGAWLKLPAAAEQLNAALTRIGAQGREFIISGFESPIAALTHLSLENVQKAGLDQLNYLAVQLEKLDDMQIAKLNAASELSSFVEDVHHITEQAYNTDFYEHYPSVHNNTELGEYIFKKSGLIQIPEKWADALDYEKLGQLVITDERGVITQNGYIAESGDEWKSINEIPKEYQIAPKIENPAIEQDTISTRTAATVTAKPAPVIPIILTAENPRERMKEITDKLEQGIKGVFDSDNYKNYLQTLSKFHNYSFNNCILIAMQKPDATHVAGFNAWRDDFKRQVRKGEKGIKILAPAPFKTKKTVDAVDADGKLKFDKNGRRVKEEKEITVPAFKVTAVFDVSQTDGEPLPQLGVNELTGSVEKYKELFSALEETSPVPVSFEVITNGAKGFYQQKDKNIVINEGMSELQNLKTLIHEIAHARLHDIDKNAPADIPRPDKDTREVQAESIAYAVCQHYGLDTSEYSFAYVATWSGNKELDILKASLDTIRKEADAIISEVDKHFSEITQNKEQPAEKSTPEQEDTFTIYQLKFGGETRDLRFEPLDRLAAAGLTVALTDYDNIYSAPLDTNMTLEKLYFTFNMDKPGDFAGHSLSVSDVVVMNRDGTETAFYVDKAGFKELPDFLTPKEQTREKPVPPIDLHAVADYLQKQYNITQAADPNTMQGQAAFNTVIKRLDAVVDRIPDEHPQLKALITHAAQSPDFNTLKERMNTLQTEFTQHYSTAVQNTVDTSGKAEPKAPAAAVRQTDTPPAPKTPAQGENVAAIEAKVKAGETINLSDLSDAIKKDKAAAQTAQTGKAAPQTPAKTGQTRTTPQGKTAAKAQQPSIKEQIAAGKQQLNGQKSAPARAAAQNKNAEIGG